MENKDKQYCLIFSWLELLLLDSPGVFFSPKFADQSHNFTTNYDDWHDAKYTVVLTDTNSILKLVFKLFIKLIELRASNVVINLSYSL